MKQSKAFKWQLGACGAAAVFLVLSTVQSTEAFQQAHLLKTGGDGDLEGTVLQQTEDEDALVEEWSRQQRRPVTMEGTGGGQGGGGWSTAPEQNRSSGSGRNGMSSQTGRS
ncbi:hypothetical protein KP806_13990 [Paenibacillus sp. N4]|uniref:hypothetical protein n=1 Tax=Paenibacillus vietnamensis TaxID=2590547 RepID=UPI001CD0BE7E|nr:hypothetical protein [Paenibacillus vietnamensis]MCA0756162.1 hypothetical protein [Paenibacillus vietnamensis]